jgi:hypothetical protein
MNTMLLQLQLRRILESDENPELRSSSKLSGERVSDPSKSL